MHNDTCETVIGKHWNDIGSIDWEGHFPILDAKLRVVRVEFIDNIEDDEDYSPVLINDLGDPVVVMRYENDDIDAYMTHADIADRPCVRPEPSRDACILMDRDLVADLKSAAKWAQEECDRLAEEARLRPDDARAFEAHASAFDRLVTILCNANK